MRLLLGLFLLLGSASAWAQSTPNWAYRYVPSTAEWNSWWSRKGDASGGTYSGGTFSGGDVSQQKVQPNGATFPRTLADMFAAQGDPAGFLQPGQTAQQLRAGTLNATPAIQAALNVFGDVLLPCGTYRLDGPITKTTAGAFSLRGVSKTCVQLQVNFAAGDVIFLNGPNIVRPQLGGFVLKAVVQRTSGNAVHLQNTYDARVEEIAFEGPHVGDAVQVDGSSTTLVQGIDCRPPTYNTVNGQLVINVSPGTFGAGACLRGTGNFVEIYARELNSYAWTYGLHVDNGSGISVSSGDFILSSQAVMIDPPVGAIVWAVYLTNIQADTSVFDNIHIEGQGKITDLMLTGVWCSNSQLGVGMAVNNPNLDGLQVSNTNVLYNNQHGMLLAAGKNITVTGSHFMSNGKAGSSGGWAGLAIAATAAASLDRITVSGSHFGHGGIAVARGDVPTQARGIFVGPPSGVQADPDARQLTIVNNQAFGNTNSGFTLTSGTKVVATGNSQ